MSDYSEFASSEVERLLAAHGVHDLESSFKCGEALDEEHDGLARRRWNRRVVKLDLKDAAGTSVYIKRQWKAERWFPRPTDFRHRINLYCAPIHEWRGLHTLQEAGFHVSQPLAVFWRGWGLSRGAIVTRAVPPSRSMADMLIRGEFERMDVAKRDSLIETAAKVIAKLHRARISWRSMKAKHFYPEDLGGNRWRIWLIDCEGIYRRASRRDCEREWRTYLKFFAARTPTLQNAFTAAYNVALSV